jgi:ribosomal protein L31E
MNTEDLKTFYEKIVEVEEQRKQGLKCTLEVQLESIGTMKIYHMGIHNPNIRIDIKLNKETEENE